ncbi:GatB/YqeY domain-containing protein [bacterium]|nr:GatB/YqeY domain-containing protein [bacterium]
MDLKTTLQNDMKSAMKSQEATRLGCLRMLIAEIKKREIDKRSALDTAEIQKVIGTLIKQRTESIVAFEKGGRADLADKEKAEVEVLKAYLPEQLSPAETESLVMAAIQESGASGPNDIGKVMKAALAKADGRADGKLINEIARKKLTPGS